MKIRIMQFEPSGKNDIDKSINISEIWTVYTQLSSQNIDIISKLKPKEIIFKEKIRDKSSAKTFPALKMGDWYFIWIDNEISKWVVIYCYIGFSDEWYSSVSIDQTVTSGPFDIGRKGAQIIKNFYNSNLILDEIRNTPPNKMR